MIVAILDDHVGSWSEAGGWRILDRPPNRHPQLVVGSATRLIIVSTDQVAGDPSGISSYFVESSAPDGTAASETLLGSYPASQFSAARLRDDG
jgi:hypothetical protein